MCFDTDSSITKKLSFFSIIPPTPIDELSKYDPHINYFQTGITHPIRSSRHNVFNPTLNRNR